MSDAFLYPRETRLVLLAHIREMFMPVRCAFCREIYDLGNVEVTARYADCSVWKTPCCGRTADDRGDTGWKTHKDYHHVNKDTGEAAR